MVDLVKFLVSSIVNKPDEVTVTSQAGDADTILLTVSVADEDMGRVIGRGGKIISAIRELVKVKAIKTGQRVKVVLQDPRQTDQSSPSEQSVLPSQS